MSLTSRSLPRESWSAALAELSDERRRATVRIDVRGPQLQAVTEASNVLLEDLLYDPRGDVFEIAVRHPQPGRPAILRHHVAHPASIELDSPAGILAGRILVRDADGTETQILLAPSAVLSS